MIRIDDFINIDDMDRRSSRVLYINIYSVVDYPRKIKVSKLPFDEGYIPDKWGKRIGDISVMVCKIPPSSRTLRSTSVPSHSHNRWICSSYISQNR